MWDTLYYGLYFLHLGCYIWNVAHVCTSWGLLTVHMAVETSSRSTKLVHGGVRYLERVCPTHLIGSEAHSHPRSLGYSTSWA